MIAEKAADLILGRPALAPVSPEKLAAAQHPSNHPYVGEVHVGSH